MRFTGLRRAGRMLAAEEALFGEKKRLNGLDVDSRLTGVMDNEDIPDDAPPSVGFRAGFDNSLPPEDVAALAEGPFAGGTTLAVSRVATSLDRWYDNPHDQRLREMTARPTTPRSRRRRR